MTKMNDSEKRDPEVNIKDIPLFYYIKDALCKKYGLPNLEVEIDNYNGAAYYCYGTTPKVIRVPNGITSDTFYRNFAQNQLKKVKLYFTNNNYVILSLCHEMGHHYDLCKRRKFFDWHNRVRSIAVNNFISAEDYRKLKIEASADRRALIFIRYLIKNHKHIFN